MYIYKYDKLTREYTGTEQAFLDPLETRLKKKKVYLLPANATFIVPLAAKDGYAQVFENEVWVYVEDNRGKAYWLPGDTYETPARTMKELGAFPEGAIFKAPEKPVPTEEEIQAQLTQAVQDYMDNKVQEKNYDNIHTACTYANSTDHIFAAEGLACVKWRDAVWRTCYGILAEVKAGTRDIPVVEELIAELPKLVWPDEVAE